MRRRSRLQRLIVFGMATLFLLSGCLGPLSNPGDLPNNDALLGCEDVALAQNQGRPTNRIALSAVPTQFDELVGFQLSTTNSDTSVVIPIERFDDGTGAFVVPLHPNFSLAGGPVQLRMIDGSGQSCPAIDFTIAELPTADGAFLAFIDALGQLHAESSRVYGVASGGNSSPLTAPLAIAGDYISSPDLPNSLQNIAAGKAPMMANMTAEAWSVLDALVAESGVLPALADTVGGLHEIEPLALGFSDTSPPQPTGLRSPLLGRSTPAQTEPLLVANYATGIAELFCVGSQIEPSAAVLSELMFLQATLEQGADLTGKFTSAGSALATAVAVISVIPTAGVPNPVTVGAGGIALGLNTAELIMKIGPSLLPSEMTGLTFSVDQQTYFEDSPDLTGRWRDAQLTTSSKGMSLDATIIGFLLGQISGGAGKAFGAEHWGDKVIQGTGDWAMGEFNKVAADRLAQAGAQPDSRGLVNIPPCTFGPTDISGEEWSVANFVPADGIARTTGHDTFAVNDTGFTELIVRPRADKFAGKEFTAGRRVEVKPIKVTINPSRVWVEPGVSTVIFTAKVEDAYNKNLDIEVSHLPFRVVELAGGSDGLYSFSVAVSSEKSDYPATVTAVSTSTTGLRAKPGAPPRLAQAIIRKDRELHLSPTDVCISPGKSQQFTAEVQGDAYDSIRWHASAGTIDAHGKFTAPKQEGQVTVRATSASDPTLTEVATVTVAEQCQCWATISLPQAGVKAVSKLSYLSFFGDPPADPNDDPGRLESIRFVPQGAGSIILQFNDEPAREPEVKQLSEGDRIGSSIVYDVQRHANGSTSYFLIPEDANPGTAHARTTSWPDQGVRLDQGPPLGETGQFLLALNHLDPDARLGGIFGMSAGSTVHGYGSSFSYTVGPLGQQSNQEVAVVTRPLWKSALSGNVYDRHLFEVDTATRTINAVPIFPELTLHIEEYHPGPEPGQLWLKGKATGDVVTWDGSWEEHATNLRIQPIQIDFQGLYRHPQEFTVPPPVHNGRVCLIDGAR